MKIKDFILPTICSALFFFLGYLFPKNENKVYVIVPDLMRSEVTSNVWKIGDKEFFNTGRRIETNYDGHIEVNFEFTSREKLMPTDIK